MKTEVKFSDNLRKTILCVFMCVCVCVCSNSKQNFSSDIRYRNTWIIYVWLPVCSQQASSIFPVHLSMIIQDLNLILSGACICSDLQNLICFSVTLVWNSAAVVEIKYNRFILHCGYSAMLYSVRLLNFYFSSTCSIFPFVFSAKCPCMSVKGLSSSNLICEGRWK